VAETLGKMLERRRAELDLTHEQLAERAGLPLPTMRNYLYNRREPSVSVANRLAKAVGVTLQELADCAMPDVGRKVKVKSVRVKPLTRKPKASD
jgi:transcriptional regulator with XRE-family HTH domain